MITAVTTHRITERILCPICRAPNRNDARFCQQCGSDVLLDNRYRITRVIKEGGMGVVYQAVDEDGQYYAVKEMHDRFTNAEDRVEGIERFKDEANMLEQLRGHPNIPQVYGFFIDDGRTREERRYYLAMEFIFGEDLEDVLKRQSRFPEAQVLEWADQLCDVLEYLHQNGLIYRDMKPSNVMITHDGALKVVDFGIAKLLQPGQRGTMIGTPGYAPAEQYQGIATVQSDVYALAATMHHLLTGRDPRDEPPFSFPPVRELRPEISRATNDAIERALQMELADRFKTVSEFRRALPIPTGERRPTRTFDQAPRQQLPPRQQAAPRPQPQPIPLPRPAQAAPAPQRQSHPAPPPAPPRAPQSRRRRGGFGRAVRRVVATGLVAAGGWYGLVQFQPELAATVEQFVTNTVQQYLEPQPAAAPAENPSNPISVLTPYQSVVEIEVTEGASDEAILEEFRKAFLTRAQQEYPGAKLGGGGILPSYAGGEPEVISSGAGFVRLRVTMSGLINVP